MTDDGWTMNELVSRVAAALGDGYPGAPNGRVRDVPDARAIRWYSTIGLVDRPAAMRGRTALYGERHLLQLVAVKRRQADGRSIAEIQAELAGASDATLRRIAALPDTAAATAPAPRSARFWTERPTPPPAQPPPPAEPSPPAQPLPPAQHAEPLPAEPPPHADTPPHAEPPVHAEPLSAEPAALAEPARAPVRAPRAEPVPGAEPPAAGPLLTGVPLPGGAVLLLPAAPDHDDLAAIAAAARPLLDLLSARGLLRSTP